MTTSQNNSKKSYLSDLLFYTTMTALGVSLTSVCYYGYKKWNNSKQEKSSTNLTEDLSVIEYTYPEELDVFPTNYENYNYTTETIESEDVYSTDVSIGALF